MIDTREIATAKIVMVGGNGGGGGTSNYNQLNNKPSINGFTLQGNKTTADLNINEMPENPLATSHGGTGNADGYIRKGVAQGSTVGNGATAEGYGNTVSGDYSHAEGSGNTASSYHAHAEGSTNTASAPQAHAEGYGTTASGAHSHAGGNGTVAGYADQTAIGKFNDNKSTTLFEVGNGADSSNKSNAFEVYANGDIVAGGTVSDINGVLNAVAANTSDAPISLLNKLKIGDTTYDATAVKPYTVSSITSGTTGVIRVNTISTNSIDGDLIAITTGSNSGTTTNAWALTFYDGGTLAPLELKKADGTGYTDAITENQLLFVIPDLNNSRATVVGIAGASGGVAESVVGPVENGTTASQAYAVGEHFIRNDKFCTAIAAIASGATLTQGTNYVEGTIAEAIIRQNTYSTDEIMIGDWFGQPLYRRCWEVQSMPNATEMTIQTGLTGLYVRFCYGCMHNISFCSNLPYVSKDNVANNVAIYTQFVTSLNIIIKSGNNQSANSGIIVIEYTKNSENP